jgi:hypothetical protein
MSQSTIKKIDYNYIKKNIEKSGCYLILNVVTNV